MRAKSLQIALHRMEYHFPAGGQLGPARIRAGEGIFEVQLERPGKVGVGDHREKLLKMDHALPERRPLGIPFVRSVRSPDKVFQGYASQVRSGNSQAVDPTPKTAFDGGMTNVVIDGNRIGVEAF